MQNQERKTKAPHMAGSLREAIVVLERKIVTILFQAKPKTNKTD